MGSPGAEKRGTRSPLPPLPQGDTSLYSGPSPQPPHSPPRSVPPIERPTQRALEEMYAKVCKTFILCFLLDSDGCLLFVQVIGNKNPIRLEIKQPIRVLTRS